MCTWIPGCEIVKICSKYLLNILMCSDNSNIYSTWKILQLKKQISLMAYSCARDVTFKRDVCGLVWGQFYCVLKRNGPSLYSVARHPYPKDAGEFLSVTSTALAERTGTTCTVHAAYNCTSHFNHWQLLVRLTRFMRFNIELAHKFTPLHVKRNKLFENVGTNT